jgi:hypothetical protein
MESPRDSVKRIVKSRSFAFLVLALLIFAVLGSTLGGEGPDQGPSLKAVATAGSQMVRTNDEVTFTGEGSIGNIETYEWDFGDGTIETGMDVVHAFEDGGVHNVTLNVSTPKGASSQDVVQVLVQLEDVHATRDLDRDRDVRPLWMHGPGLLGQVGPNIGSPISVLEYHVQRAAGTFQIFVEVWIYEGDTYRVERLHEEQRTMTGSDLDFTYTVEPEDLPPETESNESRVHIYAMIDQGRWAGGQIVVDVQFPFEELVADQPEG